MGMRGIHTELASSRIGAARLERISWKCSSVDISCYDFGGVMPIPQQSLESFVNAELKEV